MKTLRAIMLGLLFSPALLTAQGRSPIPDHWLSIDELAAAVSLSADQRATVTGPLDDLNAAIRRAYDRRAELRAQNSGVNVRLMNDAQRQDLQNQLQAVQTEFAGRQSEVEQLLGAIRSLLTADQQERFDALKKPRVLPESQGTTKTPT